MKHCWVIKLGEFKSDHEYFAKSRSPESLENELQNFESFSTNLPIVGKDLLWAFYRLFYLQFCDPSDQWKITVKQRFF